MTGREKIRAAFSAEGTPEMPVVICYEGIYIRDHWAELTNCPWWYQQEPLLDRQVAWRRDAIRRTGQDWFSLPVCPSRDDREHLSIRVDGADVRLHDRRTDKERRLHPARKGGWSAENGQPQSVRAERLPQTTEEVDKAIPVPQPIDRNVFRQSGRADLADRLLGEFGGELFPTSSVASPLWPCYGVWGFEGMMTLIGMRPDLVRRACERFLEASIHSIRLAAALGAEGIWIEECMTDMISPEHFAFLNTPFLARLIRAVHEEGMKAIYYFCGNPAGKWQDILAVGADALSLEESKKGFTIDIEDVVSRTQGRCAVLGNLDAIGFLQNGTEERLRQEIGRQIAAGRRNGSRFIMSIGSPVTPETPVDRVRRYGEIAHELGRGRQA
jgi:hypothetical protein